MKPAALLLTCLIGLAVPRVGLAQPTITTQPQSQTNIAGATATFSVEATHALPLFYQWQKNSTDLTGETNNTLVSQGVLYGFFPPPKIFQNSWRDWAAENALDV